jgi:AcrR family transcriptional regulator
MNSEVSQPLHPTAQKLVDTVIEMLKDTSYNNIKSENVLLRSGISRGPLYHHFENFEELIQTAQIQIYQKFVTESSKAVAEAIVGHDDFREAREAFKASVERSTQMSNSSLRRQRIGLMHNAVSFENFRQQLSTTQEELNQQWITAYQTCVKKGWTNPALDARAVAILMQSTFIGQTLDDISPVKMNPEEWSAVLMHLLETLFFSNFVII